MNDIDSEDESEISLSSVEPRTFCNQSLTPVARISSVPPKFSSSIKVLDCR